MARVPSAPPVPLSAADGAAPAGSAALGVVPWTWELTTDAVHCPEGRALFGLTAGAASAFLGRMHPEDALLVARWQEDVRAGGAPVDTRFRVITPQGLRRVLARARRVDTRVEGVCIDLGERSPELDVERCVQDALDRVEVAFTVLRAVRDVGGRVVDFEWLYANPEAARLLGYDTERLVGARLLELLPGNRDTLFPHYVAVVQTGAPYAAELAYAHDGIAGTFENRTVRVGDGVAIWFRDVTARARTQAELAAAREALLTLERQAREAAEHEAQAKEELLSVVSHELRSPLAAVLGWTEVLRQGAAPTPALTRGLDAIERGARGAARLVADLLDLARLDRGKLTLERGPVLLSDVVRRELDAHLPHATSVEVELVAELAEGAWVEGDATRLGQVTANLLGNALKFSRRGGRVTVRLACVDGQAVLEVEDTGAGIPAHVLPHVFERFHQGEASSPRKEAGLGLGLAIVKQLVEAHGGTTAARSAGVGQGACLTVRLPLALPQRLPAAAGPGAGTP